MLCRTCIFLPRIFDSPGWLTSLTNANEKCSVFSVSSTPGIYRTKWWLCRRQTSVTIRAWYLSPSVDPYNCSYFDDKWWRRSFNITLWILSNKFLLKIFYPSCVHAFKLPLQLFTCYVIGQRSQLFDHHWHAFALPEPTVGYR